jgi:hypothetical protein
VPVVDLFTLYPLSLGAVAIAFAAHRPARKLRQSGSSWLPAGAIATSAAASVSIIFSW